MKVLMICLGKGYAGGEFYSEYLMSYFFEKGLVAGCFSSNLGHDLGFSGYHLISREFSKYKENAKKINQFIAENDVDVVHFNGYRALYLSLLLKKPNSVAFVVTKHLPFQDRASFNFACEIKRFLSPIIFRKIDKIICVSEAEMKDYGERLQKKCVVVPNGTPEILVDSQRDNEEPFSFLYMARLAPHKGIRDLLVAFLKANQSVGGDKIKLVIAGNGEEEGYITDFINQYPLLDISYLGFVKDKKKLFSNVNCLVLPSYKEGMPLSIIEAMSSAIPTLAYNIPGVNEVIHHDANGWMVEKGNVDALTDMLVEICTNETLVKQISRNAYNSYKVKHTVSIMSESTLSVYRLALGVNNT